ncbi:MAG: site-2 protease family protein [Ruminococcus sp.]|nr:site-2 protease family protein [Ruminococcus sp.]
MNEKLFEILIHALVLFTALPVHECAHAWSAYKMGDDTAKREGRISLNPFRHLSLWGTVMMLAVGFGWGKPVNVNPSNFKNPKKGMMLSSLAGPASNFIMAYIAMVACRFTAYASFDNAVYLWQIFWYISRINLSLGVFNFLPIPPLDGSKIFNAVLPEKVYFTIMRYEQYIFMALIILIYTGALDGPLSALNGEAYSLMVLLTGWVDILMSAVLGI